MTKKFVHQSLISYTDGGARGNPGPAGIGVVLKTKNGETVGEWSKFLGITTNNQAEYRALLLALEEARSLGVEELECRLDSELVVKQLRGEYKVKHPDLKPLFAQVLSLISSFKHVSFNYIPRTLNKEADHLANQAMNQEMNRKYKDT
ncbi:ribonuclease HI family protein [Patescibacteria group bacterium]|jgi:ribonuclease HI|nr:ribonuclease HI family protein [Patescibacteria group bacterium]HPD07701.1 ribonuclease HI family protein [bacterium]HRT11025.1 ribonuclease HI family protein [Patescibacteria group bacterium]HRU89724.1 ribonuclease HI family protein [Patescibacteria group bacterium]